VPIDQKTKPMDVPTRKATIRKSKVRIVDRRLKRVPKLSDKSANFVEHPNFWLKLDASEKAIDDLWVPINGDYEKAVDAIGLTFQDSRFASVGSIKIFSGSVVRYAEPTPDEILGILYRPKIWETVSDNGFPAECKSCKPDPNFLW
jgi:hypothetical protein